MRGARPGRPAPSSEAVDPSKAVSRPIPIETDRTASRDGIVVIAHHQLRLGVAAAGTASPCESTADSFMQPPAVSFSPHFRTHCPVMR